MCTVTGNVKNFFKHIKLKSCSTAFERTLSFFLSCSSQFGKTSLVLLINFLLFSFDYFCIVIIAFKIFFIYFTFIYFMYGYLFYQLLLYCSQCFLKNIYFSFFPFPFHLCYACFPLVLCVLFVYSFCLVVACYSSIGCCVFLFF